MATDRSDIEAVRRENQLLRDRLSRICEASIRINENLDLETVLQSVLDGARSLVGARYGVITLLDEQGDVEDSLASGLSSEQADALWILPEGFELFEHFKSLRQPLRVTDLREYARKLGFEKIQFPVPSDSAVPFLGVTVRHRDENVGNFFVAGKESDQFFSAEDEETLVLFASQAALVIANARRLRDEQRARADLQTLIDTSPVGVAVFDAQAGSLVSLNREARRIVESLLDEGQDPSELAQLASFKLTNGTELTMAEALNTVHTVRAEEVQLVVPDGRSVTTLINATPIESPQGDFKTIVVTLQDLSALDELDRFRSEFIGVVSHELRMPLSSIKGSAATLMASGRSLDPTELELFFRIIDEHADQISDLITDLLDMARIDSGELAISTEPTLVETLVNVAKDAFDQSGAQLKIEVELDPGLPMVMADRRRVGQVLNNLLANAANHTPASAAIRIGAAIEDSHVALSVANRGQATSEEILATIFRRYSRIEGTVGGRGGEGTGLGLAICKGIVEAHGGRIRAEREPEGRGTRITFTLPSALAPGSFGAEARRGSGKGSARGAPERTQILVVDDDPLTDRFMRETLGEAGYGVVVTGDPDAVPDLIPSVQPRLALLNVNLRDPEGQDLLSLLTGVAEIPVVLLTAYGQDQSNINVLRERAVDYLVKPFSPNELLARVETALRQRLAPVLGEPSSPYVSGGLKIDYSERRVTVDGGPVPLTSLEYRVLYELSLDSGRILTTQQLLQRVWSGSRDRGSGPLRTVIKNLRRKLGDPAGQPRYVFTEPRVGYRLARAEADDESRTDD